MRKILHAVCFVLSMAMCIPGLAQHFSGRRVIPLDKDWQFYKGSIAKGVDTASLDWKEVQIPHTWNNIDMQDDTVCYQGDGWYRKSFFIANEDKGKRLFLRFEGVGNVADVYVNGRHIGEHRGGYAAFCFEITAAVNIGKQNLIEVKANNRLRPDVIPINHHLFANYGGIYRDVTLIVTDKINISTLDYGSSGIYIDQGNVSAQSADIFVKVKVENKYDTAEAADVAAIVRDEAGNVIQSAVVKSSVAPQGVNLFEIPIQISDPHLWNGRKDPYLYAVDVIIAKDGRMLDSLRQPLGIRAFHIEPGKGFYLNEKPYRLYGVCRHQDWWHQGNALTDSMQRADMDMIQEIGATSVRFAHYQQADLIYSLCDSMGILAWAEIPFVNAWSGQEGPNAKRQLTELIKQNYNHPSIYVWGLHNEVYCKYPTDYPARLTYELNDLAKTLDNYRYTVSTSGYGTMEKPMNLMADIQAMNRYYGWYEGKMDDIGTWLESLEKNYPTHNVVLSEYGAGGNAAQHSEKVEKPADVIKGQFFSEEYQTKLHEHQWAAIEKHPYLVSSYLWNMFDFCVPGGWSRGGVRNRNLKGLITFDRKIKKDAFYWYKANWSSDPVIHIAGRRMEKRSKSSQRIEVFSNLSSLQLYVNDQLQKGEQKGVNDKDIIWSVRLKKGKNILKATGIKAGKAYKDTIELLFD